MPDPLSDGPRIADDVHSVWSRQGGNGAIVLQDAGVCGWELGNLDATPDGNQKRVGAILEDKNPVASGTTGGTTQIVVARRTVDCR